MKDPLRIDHDDEGLAPPDGFTGAWEYYWPNRQLKFRGNFLDGRQHGRQTCWWENGRLAQSGISEHGQCKGIWSDYWPNGIKYKETEYADSKTFVVRWYNQNGAIDQQQKFIDGLEVEDV